MSDKATYYELCKSTDLKEAGSLSSLLNAELNKLSPQLSSKGFTKKSFGFPMYARVAHENRESQIYIAAREQFFCSISGVKVF